MHSLRINIESGEWFELLNWQKEDGHPIVLNDNSIIIDTYPDRFSRIKLNYYVNYTIERSSIMASSSSQFIGDLRCDLHPKKSRSSKMIFLDVPYRKKRVIKLLQFNE